MTLGTQRRLEMVYAKGLEPLNIGCLPLFARTLERMVSAKPCIHGSEAVDIRRESVEDDWVRRMCMLWLEEWFNTWAPCLMPNPYDDAPLQQPLHLLVR